MPDAEEKFDNWLDQIANSPDRASWRSPPRQRQIALIHRFATDTVQDGAGSLFYNDPNYPNEVVEVADALAAIDEHAICRSICEIRHLLEPFQGDAFTEPCLNGVATSAILQLDALLSERWNAIYARLMDEAKSNWWTP